MRGWSRVGAFVGAGLLLWLSAGRATADEAKKGLTYQGNDPYAALTVARRERKLLLVEFYADWNHRSRWMSERVLGDSTIRALVECHFVAVQVPTQTNEGAELARLYQVTGYPAILIFSSAGDVLDKIDTTLDAEDFEQRIRAILMTVQGGGTWRLRTVYGAAERADPEATDRAVEQLLLGLAPTEVANSVVWPMFENSMVMRYGSTAFDYLVERVELFRREIGAERVDEVLAEAIREAMLPYTVGSAPLDTLRTERMVRAAEELGLSSALMIRSMADVARLRTAEDLSLFVARLGLLIDLVPQSYQVPLGLSLEVVAQRGSHETKTAAADIIQRILATVRSPANSAWLERLALRLK